MSWFTDASCEAASILENAVIAYAVDLSFPSGHIRLSTWPSDLTIGGNVYTGVGTLAGVSEIPDRAQFTADRWTYSLSGVDPSVVPESEIDNCFGSSATEYEVWLHPDTHAVIGTEINREGRMGRVRRRDGGSPIIQVDVESRLVVLEQSDDWLYTAEHQAEFFSGDTGCNQVGALDSNEIIWGGKRVDGGVPGHIARRVVTRRG